MNPAPPALRTRRGRVLRAARDADAAAFAQIERAPAQTPHVMAWSEAQHRRTLADPTCRTFVYEADGAVRAYAILTGVGSPNRAVEIARVVVDGKGFGIGGDVLDAVVRHAFDDLGARRVWTDCFADNLAARRTCAHFGFREEGVLREAVLFDGRYRSVAIFGLLRDDPPLEKPRLPRDRRGE